MMRFTHLEKPFRMVELFTISLVLSAMQSIKDDQNSTQVSDDSLSKASEALTPDQIDRNLLKQIAVERQSSAMQTLYESYRPRLIPFLSRMTDEETTKDVYNEVMLKVWDCAHQFRGQSKVSTWVFTIAYRVCLRVMKRQKIHRWLFDTEYDLNQFGAIDPEPFSHQALIRKAIATLSAKHRLVIELCYFQGYALEEIAQIVECPSNTVKTRLHHARNKIRKHLEKHSVAFEPPIWL